MSAYFFGLVALVKILHPTLNKTGQEEQHPCLVFDTSRDDSNFSLFSMIGLLYITLIMLRCSLPLIFSPCFYSEGMLNFSQSFSVFIELIM